LELDRNADEPLEVLANGRVIARGEVVSVDGGHGLRITEVGSSSDRMKAAGGS
jgi:flagellar motor switch protein FliN/FliY